jgi:dTDP-4-amino-4,6-dideoxygalactose transaminase
MSDWIVPLSDVRFSAAEVEAVADTYRSGWLTQGPRVAAFERALADHVGSQYAVAVANATAALHLICVGLGLGPGDEVVLPSLTFAATAAAVLQTGATPVFADVCSDSEPWLSPATVTPLIGSRTRAIVSMAYGGHPGEALALRGLARVHELALIEDAAHALGARVGGEYVGTIGHAGAFSFFSNKNLPLGEGGMLVTNDSRLAERARLLRSHGLSAATWARHRGEQLGYDVLEPGFNYRLDEARAALGVMLLTRLAADNASRARLASLYARALEPVSGVASVLRAATDATPAWHIYPLLLDSRLQRDAFRRALHAGGVQTSVHYPPLHRTRAFARFARGALPATDEYARRTVTLPLFPHMTDGQQAHVIAQVCRAAGA